MKTSPNPAEQTHLGNAEVSAYQRIIGNVEGGMTPFESLAHAAMFAVADAETARNGSQEPVTVDRYFPGDKGEKVTYSRGDTDGVVNVAYTYRMTVKDEDGKHRMDTVHFSLTQAGEAEAIEPERSEGLRQKIGDSYAKGVVELIRAKGRPTPQPVGRMASLMLKAADRLATTR